ncbi:MAG: TetR/AcrR family transcriptional regulator [Acutalibacteraceae bacterium]
MEKRDLRVERTYLSLHNAFTELLCEKRFEDFTVNELCERAMIRRTTFYKHFADKYEYFTFYMKEISETFRDQLPPDILSKDINVYLQQMSSELIHFLSKHENLLNHGITSEMFPVLQNLIFEQMMTDIIQTSKRMKIYSKENSQKIEGMAAFYAGGILHLIMHWVKQKRPLNEEGLLKIISELIITKN